MKIEADAFVSHPAERVFAGYRDVLPRLVGEIPQVREIVVEERIERGEVVELVNHWHGDVPVPAIAQKFVPVKLSWRDRATWDHTTLSAHWEIEADSFTEAVRCYGINRFVDIGGATRVEVQGEIRIDLSKVRLLPEKVAAPIAQAIERLFLSQFTPSVVAVCDALDEHLRG